MDRSVTFQLHYAVRMTCIVVVTIIIADITIHSGLVSYL